MSGHSKWSTIKRQKNLNDAKRSNSFTKIANAITLASRLGGSGDPSSNPRLKLALEQAREANMPKENIQRAIDRGLGKLAGQTLEEVIYEGFGPDKVAFYIEAITDNKLRTLSEIRYLFDRSGGALGSSGSVSYMFDRKGQIKVLSKGGELQDELLQLIDLGIEDVEDFKENGLEKYLVYTDPLKLSEIVRSLQANGFQVEAYEITYKPNTYVEIRDQEQAEKVIDFAQKLEDHNDVQKVYANLEITSLG